ncbi:MAG TPA: methyltransferase [Nevskiaceae bacterium]|nr:methyltransferase [Nevskiaceae bacterium]
MRIHATLLLAGLVFAAPTCFAASPTLKEVLAQPHRSLENRARDEYRHPAQTLAFFGLKADQHVVEVWPGRGWYTEILAPYLRASGQYTAAGFVTDPAKEKQKYRLDMADALKARFAREPELFDKAKVTQLGPPDEWTAAPAGSADLVLTFRNVHNWLEDKSAENMFKAFHTALKPGGVLGVVEHRAKPGASMETMIKSGYVTEKLVIEMAQAAGFKLQARSEINANPRDDRDHPEGVWTLPPRLALGEKDREKYLKIGESDRMTLRFVKPAK